MPTQPRSSGASPFDVLTQRKAASPLIGQADGQTGAPPEHPDGQPPAQVTEASGSRGGKRSDPNFQKFTVYVSKHTHRAAKAIAGLQGKDLSDVVDDLLKAYVREHQASALETL